LRKISLHYFSDFFAEVAHGKRFLDEVHTLIEYLMMGDGVGGITGHKQASLVVRGGGFCITPGAVVDQANAENVKACLECGRNFCKY